MDSKEVRRVKEVHFAIKTHEVFTFFFLSLVGWVDEYGHWHSGASTQAIVKGALAVPAAIAIGFMAL
jgi:hypothetical protein